MDNYCTLAELMIDQLARTVEDGTAVFHGFGSPLVQLALHLAKRTHAPNIVLIAGATYGVNPNPPFLTPTSNDWAMDRGADLWLSIEELFDLSASGRLGRMFLSGLQIDRYGSTNVTLLGREILKMKLPGGGGGCNLSCDVNHLTLWTAAHRAASDFKGTKRYRLVNRCDFITDLGHRTEDGRSAKSLGHRGNGPQWLITDLGVFDFNDDGALRLRALYPDTSVDDILENTEFEPDIAKELTVVPLPSRERLEIVRLLDPLKVHQKEMRPEDRSRRYAYTAAREGIPA